MTIKPPMKTIINHTYKEVNRSIARILPRLTFFAKIFLAGFIN